MINIFKINFKGMFSFRNGFIINETHPDSSSCIGINNLVDISSLDNLDVSECKDLSYMFCGYIDVQNLDCLKKWDLSKCEILKVFLNVPALLI